MNMPSKLNDADFKVRLDELDNVSDEKILIEVASNDIDDYVRYKAYLKLRHYFPDSFCFYDARSIFRCKNELILTYVIKDSMYNSPKIACGRPIEKGRFIPYLFLYDNRWQIRACAVKNQYLGDEKLLMDVVLYDCDNRVRAEALTNPNLNIQPLFELMASYDSDSGVRFQATKRLHNEDILINIALNDSKASIRHAALNNPHLNNEDVVINLALNDHVDYIRHDAVNKITDENALARIARGDKVKKIRAKAIKRLKEVNPESIYLVEDFYLVSLNDDDYLKIARNGVYLKSRIHAVMEIKDPAILRDFALNDSKWRVRKAAAQSSYLSDSHVLSFIGLNDSSPRVRKAAFMNHNFTDVEVLDLISKKDSNESNRYYALKKLNVIRDYYG